MNLKQGILMIGLGGLVFGVVIAGTEPAIPAKSEVEKLDRSTFLIAEQTCLGEEGRRIRIELLDVNELLQNLAMKKGLVLHNGQIYLPEWDMLEMLTKKLLNARLEVRFAELKLIASKGTELGTEAKESLERATQIVELYEIECSTLSDMLTKREANCQMLRHEFRTIDWLMHQRDKNAKRIQDNLLEQYLLSISDDSSTRKQEILREEARRIKLALLDLRDDLQSFISQEGIVLHNGQIYSPEWEMLEMLTKKLLHARLEVRFAELRLASSEGTQLSADAQKSLESAMQIVGLYEQESKTLSETLTKRESNYQLYRQYARTLEMLESQKEDIGKRMLANQYELRLSSVLSHVSSEME